MAGWAENVLAESGRALDALGAAQGQVAWGSGSPTRTASWCCAAELTERVRGASRERFGAIKTRHHGDYHLGQVLVVGNDFQIIDFEGDPGRPLAERREKHSPLRDVAGMLCSFNYAIRSALLDLGAERAGRLERLESWGRLWEERTRQAFLEGYAGGARGAASYPENEESHAGLDRTVHLREDPLRRTPRARKTAPIGPEPRSRASSTS